MQKSGHLSLFLAFALAPCAIGQTPGGTVPVTSQTTVQQNGPTTTTTATMAVPSGTAPMTKAEQRAQRKEQKRQEKAASDTAKAAKDNSKALKAQDKATNATQKAQQPQ